MGSLGGDEAGLGDIAEDEIQRVGDLLAIGPAPGEVAVRHKGQRRQRGDTHVTTVASASEGAVGILLALEVDEAALDLLGHLLADLVLQRVVLRAGVIACRRRLRGRILGRDGARHREHRHEREQGFECGAGDWSWSDLRRGDSSGEGRVSGSHFWRGACNIPSVMRLYSVDGGSSRPLNEHVANTLGQTAPIPGGSHR